MQMRHSILARFHFCKLALRNEETFFRNRNLTAENGGFMNFRYTTATQRRATCNTLDLAVNTNLWLKAAQEDYAKNTLQLEAREAII